MDHKVNQITKAKMLLHQAINLVGQAMPNNNVIGEARQHIRQAINKIDTVAQKQMAKKSASQSDFQNWWGNVVSGSASASFSPMSAEAQMQCLKNLDAMISEEKTKLEELEKAEVKQLEDKQNELFND